MKFIGRVSRSRPPHSMKSRRKLAEANKWMRQPENANGGKGRAVCAS